MKEYQSIKSQVLALLERELPVLRERYGIKTIGIFGSVSRGEDTPESDLDIIYSFRPEMDTYDNLLDLGDFLEDLFQRKVDLVPEEWMSERFRASVMRRLFSVHASEVRHDRVAIVSCGYLRAI